MLTVLTLEDTNRAVPVTSPFRPTIHDYGRPLQTYNQHQNDHSPPFQVCKRNKKKSTEIFAKLQRSKVPEKNETRSKIGH